MRGRSGCCTPALAQTERQPGDAVHQQADANLRSRRQQEPIGHHHDHDASEHREDLLERQAGSSRR
jgi:hypothetical protein